MNKRQETYFLAGFIYYLKKDKEMYLDWCIQEREQVREFEKAGNKYPHLDEVISVIEDSIALWLGRIKAFDKEIAYLQNILREKGLEDLLDEDRKTRKKGKNAKKGYKRETGEKTKIKKDEVYS